MTEWISSSSSVDDDDEQNHQGHREEDDLGVGELFFNPLRYLGHNDFIAVLQGVDHTPGL